MHDEAANPVVIFLPVPSKDACGDEIVVDPVCGRALSNDHAAGRLRHGGRHHHFCSLACAERFAADPTEFGSR